nr:PREDICTED: uncharacterized protein LOC105679947 [Linepithema humile]
MSEANASFSWINALPLDLLKQQLKDRGLSDKGIVPTLRERLLRYEEAIRVGREPVRTPDPTGSSGDEAEEAAEGRPLAALVDSGSSRTLMGNEGIKLIRALGIPIVRDETSRIRTANGQIATIGQRADIPLRLRGVTRTLSVGLLKELAVPCIVGVDFLHEFRLGMDFATSEWYFADKPKIRSCFDAADDAKRICSGLPELTDKQQQRLENFFLEKVPKATENPGVTSLTEHRIDVGQNRPIKQRCYVVSPRVQEAIREEVDKMLAAGVIEPSYSEWSNPIVMVKKPTGKYRFCLDFRKVNSISKKDAYPLPNMNGILDKLRSASYISTIDLSQAYFQIPLARESREITAFSVPGKGLYHFTRMPYGLTGAPATFQRLLDKLIGPEMEPFAFAYLDDIVIATPTFEEHLQWLERVLAKITTAGLTINPEKCEFCKTQVRYLGFIVQKEGLTVDPEKTQPILEYPAPRNIKQLRRLLGMASWYRRFIPQFATLSEPLTRLLKKNKRWDWGEEQELAFERIKEHLTTAPTLACPNFEQPFALQTDASSVGLGAVLTQFLGGEERVIAFASRALTESGKTVLGYRARMSGGERPCANHNDEPQAGHLGIDKTYQRLAVAYFWPNMFRDVVKYLKSCDICPEDEGRTSKSGRINGSPRSGGPVDGGRRGHWSALRAAKGPKIKEALEDLVITRWGTPKFLLTDNGTEFVNRVMTDFAEENKITHTTVPPYHPQANPVERVNRILKTMIIAYIGKDHRDWDKHLADFRLAYNTAAHSSLGTSPAFLN